MYINKDLAFTPRMDLTNNINNIESIWVEILLPKTRPILIGVCYRPPKQMEFYELLEKLCDNGNSFVKYETVILGDFNTNVQNMSDVSPLLNSIKHFMQICGLKQLIEEPTRITATSESILDLIIVSDKDKIIQSGVLDAHSSSGTPPVLVTT